MAEQKKFSTAKILVAVALILGAATAVYFLLFAKKPQKQPNSGSTGTEWRKANKAEYSIPSLTANAVSVTEQGNRIAIQLKEGEGKRLFGTDANTVFISKYSKPVTFTPSEALVSKLQSKHGAGALRERKFNDYVWVTEAGAEHNYTMKDLIAVSKS